MEDMTEYRDIFLAELDENISLLNKTLLRVEKDISNPVLVKDLIRAAHTIKGMAATMGYSTLTRLTHEIESHLSVSSQTVQPNVIQTLFKAADRLQLFYDTVEKDRDPEKIGVDDLISELKMGGISASPVGVDSSVEELRQGVTYKLEIKFDPSAKLIGTRGFQALRIISSMAQISSSNPPIDVLEDGRLVGDIEMEIISYEPEYELRQSIGSVGDITEVIITNLMEDLISDVTEPSFRRVIQSVRVNLDRLDRVIDLLGELVITRGRFQSLVDHISPQISEQ